LPDLHEVPAKEADEGEHGEGEEDDLKAQKEVEELLVVGFNADFKVDHVPLDHGRIVDLDGQVERGLPEVENVGQENRLLFFGGEKSLAWVVAPGEHVGK